MIKVYSTQTLLEHLKNRLSFRPAGRGIILILDGSLTVRINEKSAMFQSGELILLAPQNIYTVENLSDNLQLYIVSFTEEVFNRYVNFNFNLLHSFRMIQDEAKEKDYTIHLNKNEFAHQLQWISQLEFYLNQENPSVHIQNIILSVASAIAFALAEKLSGGFSTGRPAADRKEKITMDFLQLAGKYFSAEKQLDFYAGQLHISIKYLSNCVREITGLPPTHFLAGFQINKAKVLLLDTDAKIYQIAEELQFSDQYAFGKFFRKHTGVSPFQFRKTNHTIYTI